MSHSKEKEASYCYHGNTASKD